MPIIQTSAHRLKRRNWTRLAQAGNYVAPVLTHLYGATLGQSNMANAYSAVVNHLLSDLNAKAWVSGAWQINGNYDATATYPPGTPHSTYGATYTALTPHGDASVVFGNALRAGRSVPIGLYNYAVGGSNLASWQPGTGANWTTFSNALAAAGGDCSFALWHQGESGLGGFAGTYEQGLYNVLQGLWTASGKTGADFKFGVVLTGPGKNGWTPGAVRANELAFVAAHASEGVFLAGSAADMNLAGDDIHYDMASLLRMSRRYAKALLHQFGILPHGSDGPKITGATRVGAVVTVSIQHNGGTLLADGAGGSGSALLGFRVYDAGSPCTISSTAISGNTVVLTLSASPSGSVTMDYAMADAPYGATTAPSSVVYDNDTVPGDTLGLPLQPHPLMSVT